MTASFSGCSVSHRQPASKEMDGLDNWGYMRLNHLNHAPSCLSGDARAIPRNAPIFFFLFFWIVPVLYFGLFDASPPWLPAAVAQRANISRLFAKIPPNLAVYELQYRRQGAEIYEIFPEEEYFKMRPFGYRSRMQRGMALADRSRQEALIQWARGRLEQRLGRGSVAAMRILIIPYEIGPAHWPGGRYRQPSSLDVEPSKLTVLSEYKFSTGTELE